MKTIHYPNTLRSQLVTIVQAFTPKSTSKLRSALPFRYSIVIPPFIARANTPANNETKLCLRCMPVICRHCRQRISVKNMPQNC